MLAPDLADYIAREPTLAGFDTWVAELSRWGQPVQATAACAAALLSLPAWNSYDAPDSIEWHDGRAVSEVAVSLQAWMTGSGYTLADLVRNAAKLGSELEVMRLYVCEASGSDVECGRRDRALAAAESVHSAGLAILWTPSSVAEYFDHEERAARVTAGPLDETVEACRKAVFAAGQPETITTIARQIRAWIEDRFSR